MRIVILPNIGLSTLHADSDYYDFIKFIQVATKFYKDMYFYLVLPERHVADADKLPNTTIIGINEAHDFTTNEHLTTQEFALQFSLRGGKYQYDALYTSRHHVGLWWKNAMLDQKRAYWIPVIFRQPVLYPNQKTFDAYEAVYAMATAVCNTISEGAESYQENLLRVKRYLSPAMVEQFERQSLTSTVGLEIDYFDMLLKKNHKYERFTLFCGMRFNTTKRVDKIFEIYDKFYASGRPIDIVMTTPNPELSLVKKDFMNKFLKRCIRLFYMSCGRHKYFEEASKCHAFLVTSDGENAPNFFVEQIYLGLVAVLPDKPYVWEMLPKDYPFVYRSADEAYSWLVYVQENYEEARQRMEPYRQYVKDNYEKDFTFKKSVDYVRTLIQGQWALNVTKIPNKGIDAIVKEVLLEFDQPLFFDAFLQVLNKRMFQKVKTSRPDQIQNRQATPFDIRMSILKAGYEDMCDNDQPKFRKIV
jgi:glycosyltransferase involved in cell wall biosynthesis